MKDSVRRTALKTLSWRVCAILGTTIIVFLFTRKISISIGVGVTDGLIKTLMYFFHERLWARSSLN